MRHALHWNVPGSLSAGPVRPSGRPTVRPIVVTATPAPRARPPGRGSLRVTAGSVARRPGSYLVGRSCAGQLGRRGGPDRCPPGSPGRRRDPDRAWSPGAPVCSVRERGPRRAWRKPAAGSARGVRVVQSPRPVGLPRHQSPGPFSVWHTDGTERPPPSWRDIGTSRLDLAMLFGHGQPTRKQPAQGSRRAGCQSAGPVRRSCSRMRPRASWRGCARSRQPARHSARPGPVGPTP
jgi:hypothetical protein